MPLRFLDVRDVVLGARLARSMSPVIELLADVRLLRDAELTKRSPRSLLDRENSSLKKVPFSLPSGNNCHKRAASESALQPVELEPGLVDDLSVELGLADDLPDKSSPSVASLEVSFRLMKRSAIYRTKRLSVVNASQIVRPLKEDFASGGLSRIPSPLGPFFSTSVRMVHAEIMLLWVINSFWLY